jgi:hypothetical protein
MLVNSARKWLIIGSLIVTTAHFLFFLVAPAIGYPLEYQDAIRLLQISVPVFFGYLGAASRFVFNANRQPEVDRLRIKNPLMGLLIRGPFIVFGLASAACLFAFGYSNRINAAPGIGMDVDTLATIVTTILGLLAVTTNIAVSSLFAVSSNGDQQNESPSQ